MDRTARSIPGNPGSNVQKNDLGFSGSESTRFWCFYRRVVFRMLHSCGAGFSPIAHSERRQYHREDDVLAHQKILAALRHELTAVYCCGEHLSDRSK